ncbi:hypothetical protein CDD82_3695 [Ophiocordyceps australis]|uniref:Uncharacterized protein n=1 Tax=Ophiocordyceps australis TaxID=1399860 RepID=A0A2C5Z5B6_9HYPO|nr:hypothetical protein CDD82_3695 [Ophiocordyceps australis]
MANAQAIRSKHQDQSKTQDAKLDSAYDVQKHMAGATPNEPASTAMCKPSVPMTTTDDDYGRSRRVTRATAKARQRLQGGKAS